MKNTLVIIAILIISTQIIFAQNYWTQGQYGKPGSRISELEKIKLIEVLQMDEETTLKFFSRRNLHQINQRKIIARRDSLINYLDKEIINGKNNIDFRNEIDRIFEIEKEISNERIKFFTSLNDILSYEQIAKLLVFEKKFRNEIRKQLIKHGRRGWKHRKNIE